MNNRKDIKSWMAVWVLMTLLGCAKEDPSSIPSSQVFVRYYGSEQAEEVIDMVQVANDDPSTTGIDGQRYLIVSTSKLNVYGDLDFMLMMTDSAGNRLWETRPFSSEESENRSEDVPSSIYLSEDNTTGWVIGTSYFGDDNESFALHQFNLADGSMVKETSFQFFDDRVNDDLVPNISAVQTMGAGMVEFNNSLILLGSVKTGPDKRESANEYSILLLSVMNDENLLTGDYQQMSVNWQQIDGFSTGKDLGLQIIKDGMDYYYLASTQIDAVPSQTDVMVKLLNPVSGNEIAIQRVGNSNNSDDFPRSMIINGSNLFITGSTGKNREERSFFLRLPRELQDEGVYTTMEYFNPDSTVLESNEGMIGSDLIALEDGNYYVVGTIKNYTNTLGVLKQDEILVTKVNGAGEGVGDPSKVYGSDQPDEGKAIWLNNDGSLMIGATMGFGGNATNIALIKTNSEAELK